MTLPVFRPLIISATFVLCSAFAGNCRAETDLPCTMTLQHRAIMLDGATCISKKRLPGCPVLCQPSEVQEKNVQVTCFRPGEPLPFDRTADVIVPVVCEIILPVDISPDTTP
ncbi:TPA: hypothetical protein OUB92_003301 [Morganella morganii]|uniref:hypothetical protein n=1 Tax=Morganella TaxID=581 RepID=UPI000448E361|nr:hypothetical protein [Morganella sp. HMSC11D09]ETO41593.1 hypothetical protein X965_07775 [Morganella sp. EGD-HP17]OFU96927.1 hypothetical protein HMPREF3119_15240 [Morganella sp. HMSC11D09]HCT9047260.1 hypothetical protein [Morganella morganii]HDU8701160.1 hypothetical protein [Morganella morganii subsp. morganii]